MVLDGYRRDTGQGGSGGGGGGSQSSASSAQWLKQNQKSATMGVPRQGTSGGGSVQSKDDTRPFNAIGKFNANLMSTPRRAEPIETPEAFAGVPILGGISHIIGEIAKAPISAIPFVGQAVTNLGLVNDAFAAEYAKGNQADYDQYFASMSSGSNWMSEAQAKSQFMRDHLVATKKASALFANIVPTPTDQTIGGGLNTAMEGLDISSKWLKRSIIGLDPQDRLDALRKASDEDLEGDEVAMAIRDKLLSGEYDDDRALDELTLAGEALMNPVGQSDPIKAIRGFGQGTLLQLPAEVTANVVAAAVSMGLELGTDPLTLFSSGTGGAIRLTGRAATQMVMAYGDDALRAAARAAGREVAEDVAGSALTKLLSREMGEQVVKDIRSQAIEGLTKNLPEGVAASPRNMVRYALSTGDPAMRAATRSVGRLTRPLVSHQHALEWVERVNKVLDPLSMFGGDRVGRFTQQGVAIQMVAGFRDAIGERPLRRVFTALRAAGVDEARLSDNMATAAANIGQQVGGESIATTYAHMGVRPHNAETVLGAAELGADMLSRHGKDVRQLTKYKTGKVRHLVVPTAGETMETALKRERALTARLLVSAYDITGEAAEQAVAKADANDIGALRMLIYGNMADSILTAREAGMREAIAAGLDPSFVERAIFLGYNQLDVDTERLIRQHIKAKRYADVRAAVERYDTLTYNVNQSLGDDELLRQVTNVLDSQKQFLPKAIPEKNLTPALKAFMSRFGEVAQISLRPEEVFGVGTKNGSIVSINPFMDYVRGKTIGIGDVMPQDRLMSHLSGMTKAIGGVQVATEQNRRFAQRMGEVYGLSRYQSDSIMRALRTATNEANASSPRGLTAEEMVRAADKVHLPKKVKDSITRKELARSIFFAYEGSLGVVGVSQKFTGWLKTREVMRGPATTMLGTWAERMFPNIRFRWSPKFQSMEVTETPILLAVRGWLNPGQYVPRALWSGTKEAVTGGPGISISRGKATRNALKEAEAHELYQTAVMMDAMATGTNVLMDVVEGTDVVRWGRAASAKMASSGEGQMLARLTGTSLVAGIKARGQVMAFRRNAGQNMRRMMEAESPRAWWTMKTFYGASDGDTAIRWFNDLLARNNPDSAYSAVKAQTHPAEFFRPSFVGAKTRVSQQIVMEVVNQNRVTPIETWGTLRRRFRDPKDTEVTEGWLTDILTEAGADPNYIERAKLHLGYADEAEFERRMTALLGKDEAKAVMDYHRAVAEAEGIHISESLGDKYADAPKSLDQWNEKRGMALFQVIEDAMIARGLKVPDIDDDILKAYVEIGRARMPDLSLPAPDRELAWVGHPHATQTELIPLSELLAMAPGNPATRLSSEEVDDLAASLNAEGMREPIQLTYGQQDRTVLIDEGNHRLEALRRSHPKGQDKVMVPVTVFLNKRRPLGGTVVPGRPPDEFGYIPNQMKPSDIGLVDPEVALFRRNEAERLRATKDLTDAERKGRAALKARVDRARNPELGVPGQVPNAPDGRLLAHDNNGRVIHSIGGRKEPVQWLEELQNNLTDDQIREAAQWYSSMRRSFMALNDNQREEAVQMLMAFGATQLNTSPVDGMRFLLRISETLRGGGKLPDDLMELKKYAGLNGPALKAFMSDAYSNPLTSEGFGFKLIDFIDSLLGMPTRTIPVRGPKGNWMPVAGDIWAKRDAGYLDKKMFAYLQKVYGSEFRVTKTNVRKVTKVNAKGKVVTSEKFDSFQFTNRTTGETHTIPAKDVGSNPNDHEYDAIVEFYNDIVDHLNEQEFLGRTDWTGAEAQAMGWFRAKKAFGDDTGDVRSAFFENSYQTTVEVTPNERMTWDDLPELSEEASNEVASLAIHDISDEAAHVAGVQVISMNGSVRASGEGRLGSAVNIEILSTPQNAETHAAVLGVQLRLPSIRSVRTTVTKPTAKNSVRHAANITFPSNITRPEMRGVMKQLAEDNPFFRNADLQVAPDGSYIIRVVSEPGEGLPSFTSRMDDTALNDLYTSIVHQDGYARGRYVQPQRLESIEAQGKGVMREIATSPATPIDYLDENWDDIVDDLYAKTREPWGGESIDAHSDAKVTPAGEENGGGPFSSAFGETLSIAPGGTRAEFEAALRQFVDANHGHLEREGVWLGVFHDVDTGTIDFDVNWLTDTLEDAEALQTHLKRRGGAYDYTSGNGVYMAQHDPAMAYGVSRTYADVIELSNDWSLYPNGEQYMEALRRIPAAEEKVDVGRRQAAAEYLDSDGRDWARMVIDRAYNTVAPREVATHRTARAAAGDDAFDLASDTGHFSQHPRGTRAARTAASDARRSTTLWQRASRADGTDRTAGAAGAGAAAGPPAGARGAITDAGGATSKGTRRAQVYIGKTRAKDTAAHEMAHDWVNRHMQASAKRRAKRVYADEHGLTYDPRSRVTELTVDEQEWLADQFVEYLRQGDEAMVSPTLRPLAAHYKKSLRDKRVPVPPTPEEQAHRVAQRQYEADMAEYENARIAHEQATAQHQKDLADWEAEAAAAPAEGEIRFPPVPEGASLGPVHPGDQAGMQWDELVTDPERVRRIKPGQSKPLHQILMSDEDYSRVLSRYSHFITPDPKTPGTHIITMPKTRPAPVATTRRYVSKEGDVVTQEALPVAGAPPVDKAEAELRSLLRMQEDIQKGIDEAVPPNLRDYGLEKRAEYEEAMAVHQADIRSRENDLRNVVERRLFLANKQKKAAAKAAEPVADVAEVKAVYTKWNDSGAKNAPRMRADLERLSASGHDVKDEIDMVDDWENMERRDFGDMEEYKDARQDAWDELLNSLESKTIPEDLTDAGLQASLKNVGTVEDVVPVRPKPEPPPEFNMVAPAEPVAPPRGPKTRKRTLVPEVGSLFDDTAKAPPPKNPYAFDVDEELALRWMYASHHRADRVSRELINARSERSWLERSLNHQYFGMYPLSYMWGKVLPEMLEFLLFKPFGLEMPLVGIQNVNKMYQHVMLQQENDPELRQFLADNEDAFRALAMFIPGLPWDLPVNIPNWARRSVEAIAESYFTQMENEGEADTWKTISDADYSSIFSDTIDSAVGLADTVKTMGSWPGLALDIAAGAVPDTEEERLQRENFRPRTTSGQEQLQMNGEPEGFAPAPMVPPTPAQQGPVEAPVQQPVGGVEAEVEPELTEALEDVTESLGGG